MTGVSNKTRTCDPAARSRILNTPWPLFTPLSAGTERTVAGPGTGRERRKDRPVRASPGNPDTSQLRCLALLQGLGDEPDSELEPPAPRAQSPPTAKAREPGILSASPGPSLARPPARTPTRPGVTKRARRLTLVRRAPLSLVLLVLLAHGGGRGEARAEGSSERGPSVPTAPAAPARCSPHPGEVQGPSRKSTPRPEVHPPPARPARVLPG